MKVKIKLLREVKAPDGTAVDLIPRRSTPDAAGFDLRSAERTVVPAFTCVKHHCDVCGTVYAHVPGRVMVKTAIAMEIESGFEGQVRPRSGLALKGGISIPNSPCTIDADYRGEVGVTLINHGGKPLPVEVGDRIAQILFKEVPPVAMTVVEELSSTARGVSGFGSTGTK